MSVWGGFEDRPQPLWRHEKTPFYTTKKFLAYALSISMLVNVGLVVLSNIRGSDLNKFLMIHDCVINSVLDYRGCYFHVTGEIWPAPEALESSPEPSSEPSFPEHIDSYDDIMVI